MNAIISTNPARCRDCYRCVRTCPVKAVRVRDGQAEVVAELCIACASCVRACPQRAKVVRDGLGLAREALAAGRTVVASVAPSAPAYFDMRSFAQMEQVLLQLGFTAAGETAFGAEMVGQAHGELAARAPECWPIIASSCPVVVNLVEQYYPDLIPHLAPVVSPMIAHGRYLREKYGPGTCVIFIGPCIAKKGERVDPAVAGVVDAALTFTELSEWMAEAGVTFPVAADALSVGEVGAQALTGRIGRGRARMNAEDADVDADVDAGADEGVESLLDRGERSYARLFPVEGGLVGTAHLDTDLLSGLVVTGSGIGACQNVLEGVRSGALEACMVELMACEGGCINGPALMDQKSVALARQRVLAYAAQRPPYPLPPRAQWPSLERTYRDRSVAVPAFSEEQIQEVLRRVDKHTPEDELNCGACGYGSCREKAIATLRGMAEATMCIPYMRSRAESLTNVVMQATPNANLILDHNLCVQALSLSAEVMLRCKGAAVRGRPVREILPVVDDFLAVRQTGQPMLNKIVHQRPDLIVEQSIVPVGGENLIVAILHDVTERERQREELARLRSETLQRSQDVINRQMRVAHEIAGLLGETTAETKVLLTQLARLMEESKHGPTG